MPDPGLGSEYRAIVMKEADRKFTELTFWWVKVDDKCTNMLISDTNKGFEEE